MFKVDIEKAEEPEIKLSTPVGSSKKAREFQENKKQKTNNNNNKKNKNTSTSALLIMPKTLTV